MRARSITFTSLVLVGTGIALAAMGQWQTTHVLADFLSWLAPYAGKATDVYPNPKAVLAGMLLLGAGAALFAAARHWASEDQEGANLDAPGRDSPPRWWSRPRTIVAFSVGGITLVALLVPLYRGEYTHWFIALFLLALALFAMPFAARDLTFSRPRPRWRWLYAAEMGFLAAMMALFFTTNLRDLTSWRFSAEGDEYAFYYAARDIAQGGRFNPFSQDGVHNMHPVLSSAYQAIFVRLSAGDVFAWKLSMVSLVAVTMIPFYLLIRELFSWRPAMLTTALMAASHYLMALAHTGFNNLDALFPTVLALWLLVVGLRRDSRLALFASGVAAGLGFYVFFAGRAAIVIVAVYMATMGRRGLRPAMVLPIAIAFAATVAPIFTLHGWGVIHAMLIQSAASSSESGGRVARIAHNIVPSIMAFNYNPTAARYTSGSLLDPMSAVLFALGLGLAVAKVKQTSFRLLLVWWAVATAMAGLGNPRAEVSVTRMVYALPAAVALAGVALDRLLAPLVDLTRRPAVRAAVPVVALAMLLPPILYLNLHRFWSETPRVDPATYEAVVMRGVTSAPCQGGRSAVVTPQPKGLLSLVFAAYQLGNRSPLLLPYDAVISPSGRLASGHWDGCIIVDPQSEQAGDVAVRLGALFPLKRKATLTDDAGSVEIPIFH